MFLKLALFGCLVAIATARYANPNFGFRLNKPKIGARIVGGEEAAEHEFPHLVSLQLGQYPNYLEHFCAGVIIDNSWVLTAGHCPYAVPEGLPFYIKAGKHSIDVKETTEQTIKVEKYFVHEEYKEETGPYDIALLKLQRPLIYNKFVKAIKLPKMESQVDGEVVLSGWGSVDGEGDIYPEKLQKAKVPIVDWKTCKSAMESFDDMPHPTPITEKNVCTGPLTGGVSACMADSGGPLIKFQENAHEELVGLVSWGYVPCGTVGAPTVYTRVSAFIDWIQDKISKEAKGSHF